MTVKNIEELFAHDGRDFVIEAYRNLLKREPDENGLMYYLGRLAHGHSKADVIAQLAKSPECRPLDEIAGLKNLATDSQRTSSWFRGWFWRRSRIESAVYSGTTKLAQIGTQLASTNQHLVSLQDALQIAANEHTQQMENLVRQVAQVQIATPELDQLQDEPLRLSSKTVEQAFMDILCRAPESVDVINQFAKSESDQALREELMRSDEFQSSLAPLPEYARSIFLRQLNLHSTQEES